MSPLTLDQQILINQPSSVINQSSSVTNQPSSVTIVQQEFKNLDAMNEVLNSRRSVHLIQLGSQPFRLQIVKVQFGDIQLDFFESGVPFHAVGTKLSDYIDFSFILRSNGGQVCAHKIPVCSNTLFGFDPDRPIDLVVPPRLLMALVQVKKTVFNQYLQSAGRSDIDHHFLNKNCVYLGADIAPIQNYLKDLLHLILHCPAVLEQPDFQRLILEDLLPMLIGSLPAQSGKRCASLKPLRRAEVVEQATTYMMTNLDEPLTLKDLCKTLNTSSRALNYGFHDVYGLSPMAYLKQLRLHHLRRVLLTSDLTTTSVWNVMTRFGFWSRGHFANDYKSLFGESPSETLACRN